MSLANWRVGKAIATTAIRWRFEDRGVAPKNPAAGDVGCRLCGEGCPVS